MVKVDIEELGKLNYEQGAELLTAAGYVKGEESTADERRPSGFAKDEYWRLYGADAYAADTVRWAKYFSSLKNIPGDTDGKNIILARWEHIERIDIEELKKMNYEDGRKFLTAAGYEEWYSATDATAGVADFIRDENWALCPDPYADTDTEAVDKVSWTEYFNIIKYNPDDLNDEEIIRAGWERYGE